MRMLFSFMVFSPLLLMMEIGLIEKWRVKEKLFAWHFKGMTIQYFNRLCKTFATHNKHKIIRPLGFACIHQAQQQGEKILIISASFENWVAPFFDGMESVRVVGTQLEVEDERLTGKFASKNCYGQEKVNRLLSLYPKREEYNIIAYGDSKGDKELLMFSDEGHYKPFRQ